MRPLTCTILLSGAVMHPRATAGVRGGTAPGFSQIAILGLLSSTGVALASNRYPYLQQDRSNTIGTSWKGIRLARLHYGATKDGARAHTAAANRRIRNPNNVETNAGQPQRGKNQCSIQIAKAELKSAIEITSGIKIWDWSQMLESHNNLHLKSHTRSNMSVQRRTEQQTWSSDMAMPQVLQL